ncbi:MAG: PRC-barrel domain-containing protein [Thermoplasmatota archaeon]
MIEEKNTGGRTTFNEMKGTKVYDSEGTLFGHVSDIEINLTTLNPTNLIIHKGFFGEYIKINLKYIEKITPNEIKLWISPAKRLEGSRVVDCEGNEIGEVKEAEKDRDGNLEYIRVEARIIRTKNERGEFNTYAVPITSFEDMSLAVPTAHIEEGSIAGYMDIGTRKITIDAKDIVKVYEDKIVLSCKKEEYIND